VDPGYRSGGPYVGETAFVAPKGRGETNRPVGIHPHRTHTQFLRHTDRPTYILGPHTGRQTEVNIITNRDGVFFRIERNDGQQWAKNLFLCNAHFIVYISKNRRLDKLASFCPRTGVSLTAQHTFGTVLFRDLDIVEYFLVLGGCGNRANMCVGRHRITDLRRFRDLNQALHKLVVYGTL
jgi:hypothetical protein